MILALEVLEYAIISYYFVSPQAPMLDLQYSDIGIDTWHFILD